MRTFAGRIAALIVKELLTMFRDPKGRVILIVPPIMQMVVFAFAATLEVKNIGVVIYNQDIGSHGAEIVHRLAGSPAFTEIAFVDRNEAIRPAIDQQKAIAAISIPQDFSRDIEAGRAAMLQVILDGRRSNAAQIVNGYITTIITAYGNEIEAVRGTTQPSIRIDGRNWFNENLLYRWFTLPSLVGILAMMIALVVTSLSVARERELGTFDQLLVSPLMPLEILVGKTVPAVIVGIAEGLLIWTVAITAFGIPFKGSFLLLLFALFIFIMATVGTGLFISSISKTQQQAVLGTFIFMVPAVTLSGYTAPVENMPLWLQKVTYLNPLKYFLITLKGLFLKDMSFHDVWTNTWPLLIIGGLTMFLAGWFFTKRLE